MPMYAICSSFDCDFQFSLQDNSAHTPTHCPKCNAHMIALCPHCSFPLVAQVGQRYTRCAVCGHDIRRTFWALRARSTSA